MLLLARLNGRLTRSRRDKRDGLRYVADSVAKCARLQRLTGPTPFNSALSWKGRNCCNSRPHLAIDTGKGPDSPPCCHTLAQPRLLGLEYRTCYLTLFPPDRTRCHHPRGGTKASCSSRRKGCGGTNQRQF